MKFERHTRKPATDDSTMMRPCPCRRNWPATADMAAAGQVKLTVIMSTTRSGQLVGCLGPELPYGDDDKINRLVGHLEPLRDGLVEVVEGFSVEGHGLDTLHVDEVLCRSLERHPVASGEDDGSPAVGGELCNELTGDVRSPAEHEDRLRVTEGVIHRGIRRRRERSEDKTPLGSTLLRTFAMSPSLGYMTGRSSGRSRESLAR